MSKKKIRLRGRRGEWPPTNDKYVQRFDKEEKEDEESKRPKEGSSIEQSGNPGGGSIAHDPRPFVERLLKCPHGVLRIKKCAICDPEGWYEENG